MKSSWIWNLQDDLMQSSFLTETPRLEREGDSHPLTHQYLASVSPPQNPDCHLPNPNPKQEWGADCLLYLTPWHFCSSHEASSSTGHCLFALSLLLSSHCCHPLWGYILSFAFTLGPVHAPETWRGESERSPPRVISFLEHRFCPLWHTLHTVSISQPRLRWQSTMYLVTLTTDILSCSSGGLRSKIKVFTGLVPSEIWGQDLLGGRWLSSLCVLSHHLPSVLVSGSKCPLEIKAIVKLD